ncbi:hypothetical protein, partial [Pseudomonas aeruginosa]|uniref:hypothetical protein n=1 Tax=Pseudomonas aeruginosa TaxID=287 RepID=UPI000B752FE7
MLGHTLDSEALEMIKDRLPRQQQQPFGRLPNKQLTGIAEQSEFLEDRIRQAHDAFSAHLEDLRRVDCLRRSLVG